MVSDSVLVKKKWRRTKLFLKLMILIILVLIIFGVIFLLGFFKSPFKGETEIVLEHPLKNIIFKYTTNGSVDKNAVVDEAMINFNEGYINYLLVALGVGNLHSSFIYGNPSIEFVLGEEVWNSEVSEGGLDTEKSSAEKPDLRVVISKNEAVEALLASDIEEYMKESVSSGRTTIEMVAGYIELGSKGYLQMYKDLTGEELEQESE
jgi:hypothetical protein